LVKKELLNAGFDLSVVMVDELLKESDSAGLHSKLRADADATVVISALRWNHLSDLVDPRFLRNGVTLTTNRAATLAGEAQPVFALSRPIHAEEVQEVVAAVKLLNSPASANWREFEKYARRFMSLHIGVELQPRRVGLVPKVFDMVSGDLEIVGDAKYLTLVRGQRLPPAKFMEIASHVWLLEATKANRLFLIFGNDRRVAEWWLEKYGHLVQRVEFYFLEDHGQLSRLR
jgi:hypothetical protein